MMINANSSVVINTALEKVFDYAASPINGPVFIPNLSENTNISPETMEVGQAWDWRFNMAGVDLHGSAEVTAFNKPHSFSLKTTGGVTSDWTYTFAQEDGGTKVTLEVSYDPPQDVLGKMSAHVIEKVNQKNVEQGLQNLKTILEAE